MNTCPKCGRQYSAPPAMSRIDNTDICPVCGAAEALAGRPEAEEGLKVIEEKEIEAGRVEARCGRG